MKKLLVLLLALLVVSSTALARNVLPIKPLAEIDLYGVNDFHGHITGSAIEPGALAARRRYPARSSSDASCASGRRPVWKYCSYWKISAVPSMG